MRYRRTLAYLAAATAILVVLGGIVMAWMPPSPARPTVDSYSGRSTGSRALLETLDELGHEVRRNRAPGGLLFRGDTRVLLIYPNLLRLAVEKDYLKQLGEWVEGGGEVILTLRDIEIEAVAPAAKIKYDIDPANVLKTLGIEDVALVVPPDEEGEWFPLPAWLAQMNNPPREYRVRAEGALAPLLEGVDSLTLSTTMPPYFELPEDGRPDGLLQLETAPGEWQPYVLLYRRKRGQVVFAADAFPFLNKGIGRGDNAVFAYRLATGDGSRPVVIDDYYRNLPEVVGWRGIVTRYPYSLFLLGVLLAVLCWIWMNSVAFGPRIAPPSPARRRIGEFIDAMAALFRRAGKTHFTLKTCRDGLLDELRDEFLLPPAADDQAVTDRIARREPDRARRVRAALEAADEILASPRHVSPSTLTKLQEMLDTCRK